MNFFLIKYFLRPNHFLPSLILYLLDSLTKVLIKNPASYNESVNEACNDVYEFREKIVFFFFKLVEFVRMVIFVCDAIASLKLKVKLHNEDHSLMTASFYNLASIQVASIKQCCSREYSCENRTSELVEA